MELERDAKKAPEKPRAPAERPQLDRRDPPGGQVSHADRKGSPDRQPEEPHGDSEAV